MEAERQRRVALNESAFRDVNERIAGGVAHWFEGTDDFMSFVCECGDTGCAEVVNLTRSEYERVRAHGARFAIVAGHDMPDVERVVERNERFSVVEKIHVGADVAKERNPRS